ncbi:MAG TPA: hypothetical protein VGF22_06045, partial [Acidimicrobiales bacterium]
GRGAGMYVALLAAFAALVGSLLNLHNEGDTVGDVWATMTRRSGGTERSRPLPPPEPGTPPGRPPTASR